MVDSGHTKMKHEGETLLGMYSTKFNPLQKDDIWFEKEIFKSGEKYEKNIF